MALHARTAASVAVLVALLAAPLVAVAEPSRSVDAGPKRPHTAQKRARPQAPSRGAARAARGQDQAAGNSQGAWDQDAVVRWEDQDGTVHYTRGYEVPQRFRPKVRHVRATVGTVPLDRAETKKPAASLDGPSSAAALPMIALPPGPLPPPAAGTPQAPPSGAPQPPSSGAPQPPPSAAPQPPPSGAPQGSTAGARQQAGDAAVR